MTLSQNEGWKGCEAGNAELVLGASGSVKRNAKVVLGVPRGY